MITKEEYDGLISFNLNPEKTNMNNLKDYGISKETNEHSYKAIVPKKSNEPVTYNLDITINYESFEPAVNNSEFKFNVNLDKDTLSKILNIIGFKITS